MKITRTSKMIVPLMLGLMVIIALSGCTRSKSTATVAVGTAASDAGFSVPTAETTQTMGIFDNLPTATLAAGAIGDQGSTPLEATPQPAATATPESHQAVEVVTIVEPTAIPASSQILPTAGPNPATYALQKGEYPFCIARRFNVDQYELLSINGLGNGTILSPGTVLKIPTTGNPFVSQRALKTHPAQYKVVSGDSIYSIACAYGDVRPEQLAAANNLAAPYTLTSGMVLNIP